MDGLGYLETHLVSYVGGWSSGIKSGIGTLFYDNGDVFVGRWKPKHFTNETFEGSRFQLHNLFNSYSPIGQELQKGKILFFVSSIR